MKTGLRCGALLLLLASAGAEAQLYKWIGADGKVNYSDLPPPPTARSNERKSFTDSSSTQADLPFELTRVMQMHPVVLYTMNNCAPCDEGRALLNARGIPYAEKTVTTNEDIAQLRSVGGASTLPLLMVGRSPLQGMEPGAWHSALDHAGYPASSKLPKTYRQAAAEPAVPARRPAAAEAAPAAEPGPARGIAEPAPAENGNAPPGFRF